MIRQLLIDCRDWIRGFYGDKPMELLSRLNAALAAQHTAADDTPSKSRMARVAALAQDAAQGEPPLRCPECKRTEPVWDDGGDPVCAKCGHPMDFTHPPHPQVNEPPSSLTSGRGKEMVTAAFVKRAIEVFEHAKEGPEGMYINTHAGVRAVVEFVADQLAGGGK